MQSRRIAATPGIRNVALVLGLSLAAGTPLQAGIAGLELVADGLSYPVYATHSPGDQQRLFVVQKRGTIKLVDLATGAISDFLHIPETDALGESGLLGLAFHPNYALEGQPGFGKFYVYVTIDNGGVMIDGRASPLSSHVREYRVMSNNPNAADSTSAREIISWVKPTGLHSAGWIGFNPAITPGQPQYLYIASGDGGLAEGFEVDPTNHAQTIVNDKLGKILRLDIDGDDFPEDAERNYAIPPANPFVGETGDDEIWAYGLRNPWQASFDQQTGDFWIGDVGWSRWEGIDYQPADWPGGANYGWRLREGDTQTPGAAGGPAPVDHIEPVYVYSHIGRGLDDPSFEGNSVIGGHVYRGPDPDLQGKYIFGDTITGRVWHFDPADPMGTRQNVTSLLVPDVGTLNLPVSFGRDPLGNLYIVDYDPSDLTTGKVYRLVTDNLIPGDYDADGDVDADDYRAWSAAFGTSDAAADGNGDGVVDAADYAVWRTNLGSSVHSGTGSVAAAGENNVVPEPSIMSSVLLLFVLRPLCRRRPQRQN